MPKQFADFATALHHCNNKGKVSRRNRLYILVSEYVKLRADSYMPFPYQMFYTTHKVTKTERAAKDWLLLTRDGQPVETPVPQYKRPARAIGHSARLRAALALIDKLNKTKRKK